MKRSYRPVRWAVGGLLGLLGLISCSGSGGGDGDASRDVTPPIASQSIVRGEPPKGSPRFLSAPFDDESVIILDTWYYSHNFDLGCTHPHDRVPTTRHCAVDYIKGDRTQDGLTWEPFPVVAAAPGLATTFVTFGLAGTYVTIEHEEFDPQGRRFSTHYLHLDT